MTGFQGVGAVLPTMFVTLSCSCGQGSLVRMHPSVVEKFGRVFRERHVGPGHVITQEGPTASDTLNARVRPQPVGF